MSSTKVSVVVDVVPPLSVLMIASVGADAVPSVHESLFGVTPLLYGPPVGVVTAAGAVCVQPVACRRGP